LLGALGCGIAGSAWAAPVAPAVAARVEKLRKEATALYRKRDPEAIERLRAAWELSKNFVDLCNLGKFQFNLGLEKEGAATLERCLALIPPPEVDKESAVFRTGIERSLKLASALLGKLEIEANVPGAEVLIDGELVGKLPLDGPIFVDPGWRNVEVRAPSFKSDIKRFEARKGEPARLKMKLEKLQAEVVAASHPEEAPASGEQPPAEAKGRLRMAGAAPQQQEKRSLRTGPLVTGIALSVVGAAFGVGGIVVAKAAFEDADAAGRKLDVMGLADPCSAPMNRDLCKEYSRALDATVPFTALGIGGLAVLGIGGTIISMEITRAGSTNTKNNSPAPTFVVTPSGNGLIVGGSF
jgi:hypothetical protein